MGWVDQMNERSLTSLRILAIRFISLTLILQLVTSSVTAYIPEKDESDYHSPRLQRLVRVRTAHVDSPSQPSVHDAFSAQAGVRRELDSNTVTASLSSSTTVSHTSDAAISSTTGTEAGSSSVSSSSSSATSSVAVVATTLPTPFDTSLGSNFTESSCPDFFRSFLNNSTFASCHPVSLLLQNSLGFFQAARSAPLLNATLDAACSASLAICSPLMSSLASSMIADNNCGADYRRQNFVVMQAYAGLLAYEPLYNATCLQDPLTGKYCYSEAIIDSTNPSDSYPYYTALGIPLPSGAQPTCSTCLQRTMNTFAGYAKLKGQPLAQTYLACASQVDNTCGSSFANTQVQVGSISSNDAFSPIRMSWPVTLVAAGVLMWQILG